VKTPRHTTRTDSGDRADKRYHGTYRRHIDVGTDPILALAERIQARIAAEDVDGFGWSA